MEPTSRGMPVWLLLLGALGAIIGFAWSEQDYVAATALAVMALAGLWGYYVGALRLVGFFGGLAAAYGFASPVGNWLSPHLARLFESSPNAIRGISVAVGGGIVLVAAMVAVSIVSRWLLSERPHLQVTNRLLGFGVGGIQGTAAMLLLLNGILMVEPYAKQRLNASAQDDGNVLARMLAVRVIEVAEGTRRSTIASLVRAYNPFEKLPQLKKLQRTATVVSSPDNPTTTQLPTDKSIKSEVRRVIESLAQDPQLRKLAQSKEPLNHHTAASLLNHPEIVKLLEHPDLLNQLSQAMDDLESQSANTRNR